jgi:molybdopterin molybdotransferase
MHFEAVTEYQLYNTNTPSLLARAQELGCEVEFLGTAHDTLEDIHQHIKSALECDFVITSGGVSVGEKDFTKEAFGAFGYEIFFDKVEIKPGKPTTFGKIGNTMILNLPGNPLAAALNFELFGCATIYAMRGATHKFTAPFCATLTTDIDTRTKRRTLIPGFYDGNNFTPSDKYAPGMVAPLASANGFIIIDTTSTNIQKGSSVQVISTKYPLTATEPKNLISF